MNLPVWMNVGASVRKGIRTMWDAEGDYKPPRNRIRQWLLSFVGIGLTQLGFAYVFSQLTDRPMKMLHVLSVEEMIFIFAWVYTYRPKTRWVFAGALFVANTLSVFIEIIAPIPSHPTSSIMAFLRWEASVVVPLMFAAGAALLWERRLSLDRTLLT
ncbi:hypothetical protein CCAX7_56720 [Capsulimonas corticalis]|uniref:Uncharacterized protein n=1 Tax=Capsulimonas corticalis TaxID=2219043 RepID=A0A402D0K6_9BACT|nr:hypothetical protein [Capsulimonas corticalis]BDI33621.1 hypothetical protein CCAX7_56720 [Capsulimonas corticalis]